MSNSIEKQVKEELLRKLSLLREENFSNVKLIPEEKSESPKSDILIELQNKTLAIELENHQVRPESNYVKYLRLIKEKDRNHHFTLIHIFSKWYGDGPNDSRAKNIACLNDILEEWRTQHKFHYIPEYFYELNKDPLDKDTLDRIVNLVRQHISDADL